jgi:hypothetical protein
VKVLLDGIHEQSVLGNTESLLIHIRRQTDLLRNSSNRKMPCG